MNQITWKKLLIFKVRRTLPAGGYNPIYKMVGAEILKITVSKTTGGNLSRLNFHFWEIILGAEFA